VLQCLAVCCSVVQCVAVCCGVLQCVAVFCIKESGMVVLWTSLQCAASVLQCVALCCIEKSGMIVFKDLRVSASRMKIRFPEECRV